MSTPEAARTDDDSMGDFWRDVKAAQQAKRADNRTSSRDLLTAAGITFAERNNGAHLIVQTPCGTVDFWPGTGLWIVRGSTLKRRGVRRLMHFCGVIFCETTDKPEGQQP